MKKGLISKVATTGLAMSFLVSGGLFATNASAAGDYRDTPFEFNFYSDGGSQHTDKRAKLDYTSSYVYNNPVSTAAFTATVHGSNNLSSSIGTNLTYGTPRLVGKGESKYLPNLVKERGYTYAQIGLTPNVQNRSVRLKGEWSPDSI